MIRFGRLGTTGQSMVKTFDDSPRAGREMAKLIAEKTRKGYVEAG
jgi:predicted DNA-binding WGR domain protein